MEYTGINDYEVLYMIGERDEVAYNVMYDKYRPLISKIAHGFYRAYKGYGIDYEELYLEGMVSLNNAIREFSDSNKCLFYTYLSVCVKRGMEAYLRGKVRYKHMVLTTAVSLEQEIEGTDMIVSDIVNDLDSNIEGNVLSAEFSKKVLDIKYTLSPKQALIYELKLNNFTNKEIAQLLDISYKTVDNSCKLIRSKIKKYVGQLKESVLYL